MTRASDFRPTRRVLSTTYSGDMVVELRDTTILLRPKGARSGGPAEVSVTAGQLYDRLMEARVDAKRRERARTKRARKGGRK